MVSSSSAKQRTHDDATASNEQRRLSKRGVVPASSNALAKQTFYLDVQNAIACAELQRSVKELGGSVDLFLSKEVSLVVSDSKECANGSRGAGSHPRTPQTPIAHSTTTQQQDASVGEQHTPRGRPKTRADTMLECVWNTSSHEQQQPAAQFGHHILEQAKAWGVPVWSVDKTLAWLKQLRADSRKSVRCKVLHLKGPYIKFEAFGRLQRPVFKEIRNWPYENVRGAAGSAAVLHKPAAVQQIMTRAARIPPHAKVDAAAAPLQSGYCEICREDYANLSAHLDSNKHLLYVNNNTNYTSLDALIANGTDLETFLSANGHVATRKTSAHASHKMPKARVVSSSNECNGTSKVKNGPISTSARKPTMTYIAPPPPQDADEETQAELAADTLPLLHCRELRSHTALSKFPDDTWKSGRPKRSCISRKRPTYLDDAILASEHRNFYKVEMPHETAIDEKKSREELDADAESLIVKFKRMRSSELRQLNDEAENFLFPKVKEEEASSDDTDIDMNCPDTTASTRLDDTTIVISSAGGDEEATHLCDNSEHSECSKKRKRLSQAEAFIEDNKKYYKFETPGTRLRYHGGSAGEPSSKRVRRNGDVKEAAEDVTAPPKVEKTDDGKFTLDELQFSFETVPKSEPWYETFSRQDHGAEYYTCFSDSGYWKRFLLPYEMEHIPPLDPKVCIQTYTQIKKIFSSEPSSGTDCSAQSSPAPFIDDTSKTSEDASSTVVVQQCDKSKISVLPSTNRRKSDVGGVSRNPRKSPRQHASTLAILSSLIQHRKKRKLSSPNNSLGTIAETPELAPTNPTDAGETATEPSIKKVAESIDDMLVNSFVDIEVPLPEDEADVIGFSCKSDAIALLEEYDNSKTDRRKTASKASNRRTLPSARKTGRKRKKNRTGWPKHSVRRTNQSVAKSSRTTTSTVTKEDKIEVVVSEEANGTLANSVNCNINSKHLSVVEVSGETSWDNADKVLSPKTSNNAIVESATDTTPEKRKRRMQGSSSPTNNASPQARHLGKRARRMPASPKSPRVLRKPRGRWYRER